MRAGAVSSVLLTFLALPRWIHEPRAASVLSHGNYSLLPWQNNNSLNKEHNTDELSDLTHLLPLRSPSPSFPHFIQYLFFRFVLCCWFIFLTTLRLHRVCPK